MSIEVVESSNRDRINDLADQFGYLSEHVNSCLMELAESDLVEHFNEHSMSNLAFVLNPDNFKDRKDGLTHELVLQLVFPQVDFEDKVLMDMYTQLNIEAHTPILSKKIINSFEQSNVVCVVGPMFAQKSSGSVKALLELESEGAEVMWSVSAALGQGYIKARDIDQQTLKRINEKRIDLNDSNIDETIKIIQSKISSGKDLYFYFDEATFTSESVLNKLLDLASSNNNFKLLISGLNRGSSGKYLSQYELIEQYALNNSAKILQTGAFDIFAQNSNVDIQELSEHKAYYTGRAIKFGINKLIADLGFAHPVTPDDFEGIIYFAVMFLHHTANILVDNIESLDAVVNPDEETINMQANVTQLLRHAS